MIDLGAGRVAEAAGASARLRRSGGRRARAGGGGHPRPAPRRPVRGAAGRARARRRVRRPARSRRAPGGCSWTPPTRRRPARCWWPTIRWWRSGRWPARGAARSAAAWWGSPAPPARPRPRTSSPRCCAPRVRTHASRENLNTEIGLPLSLLEAPRGTEVAVLEMAMRGEGQIAELAAIAEPDVGVIVNVGPVHLELLGTVERVAAAKAELIRDLRPGAACVLPASEPLLDAHRRADLDTWTFGPGGRGDAARLRRAAAPRSRRAGRRSSSTSPTRSRTTCSTRWPGWPRRGRWACPWAAPWTCASPRCAGRSWSSRAALWS